MVNPQNEYIISIIWTKKIKSRIMCVYACMHAMIAKEAMKLKESMKGLCEGLQGWRKHCKLYYNLKKVSNVKATATTTKQMAHEKTHPKACL